MYSIQWKLNILKSFRFSLAKKRSRSRPKISAPDPILNRLWLQLKTSALAPQHWNHHIPTNEPSHLPLEYLIMFIFWQNYVCSFHCLFEKFTKKPKTLLSNEPRSSFSFLQYFDAQHQQANTIFNHLKKNCVNTSGKKGWSK